MARPTFPVAPTTATLKPIDSPCLMGAPQQDAPLLIGTGRQFNACEPLAGGPSATGAAFAGRDALRYCNRSRAIRSGEMSLR